VMMSKDGRYSVTMNITKENCVCDADVRDWSMGGVIYYKLPVFFEGNAMILFTNNWNMTNMNERRHDHDHVNVVWTNKRTNGFVFVGRMNARGGMQTNQTNNEINDSQQSNVNNQYAKEIGLLKVFSSEKTKENNEAKEGIKEQNKLEQVKEDVKMNKIEREDASQKADTFE
ncbi:hypothetical protein RFI_28306, partial [Reticulomyxa filosa]